MTTMEGELDRLSYTMQLSRPITYWSPNPNADEMIAVYRHIRFDPKLWAQDRWVTRTDCGTAFCYAGLTTHRAGWQPTNWHQEWGHTRPAGPWATSDVVHPDDPDRTRAVDLVAAEILHLDPRDAARLFMGVNTLDDLRRIITGITGRDPEIVYPDDSSVGAEQMRAVAFNDRWPLGTMVRYWRGVREGEPSGVGPTYTTARILGGHTAVVWIEGCTGCIALTHVEPVQVFEDGQQACADEQRAEDTNGDRD